MSKKDVVEDEIELIDIINFLWKKRKTIILLSLVLFALALLLFVYEQRRNYNAEGEAFSSLNIDRVERGVYRMRARIFGQENNVDDEGLAIDFDRDFDIIITESGELLALTVESHLQNVEVTQMRINGRLRNRSRIDDFNAIELTLSKLNLREGMRSREFPIPSFTTNSDHEIQYHNRDLLFDIAEFREYFVLEFLEIGYYELFPNGDRRPQLWQLRYNASQDLYELIIVNEQTQSTLEDELVEMLDDELDESSD